jgi:hypothetical protein
MAISKMSIHDILLIIDHWFLSIERKMKVNSFTMDEIEFVKNETNNLKFLVKE